MDCHRPASNLFWTGIAPFVFLLLWANGFVFLKIGLAYADPITFLALRYACVLAVLLIPVILLRPAFPKDRASWISLLGIGLFLQAGYFGFTYLGLYFGLSAGVIALITCQQPVLIGILAPLVLDERVSLQRWSGLLLGVSGAVIVVLASAEQQHFTWIGLMFGVFALLSISVSTLIEKRRRTQVDVVSANLVQYAVGLAAVAPLAFWLEPMHIEWTWSLVMSLAYLVLGASLLAISLLLAMIRRGEAARVSSLFFLVPPVTALVAFVVLDEPLSAQSLGGMALAALGIYLASRKD